MLKKEWFPLNDEEEDGFEVDEYEDDENGDLGCETCDKSD